MEIKLVDSHNFTRDSLKGFRRYQEVKNVYRLQNGNLTLVCNPFTEDWDAARLIEKAEEILSGQYVTYCAYEGNHVVGVIMLIPGLNKGRLIIDSFHVSTDYRHRGIGRALFEAARQEALKRGAHALYASCCSSEETIDFYSAMGFRLSSDPIPALAEAEPYDLQMECLIIREMQ
ncbi:MAG: GNAT family N-acetyltransferase [Oscillospiraceae bacterium]|nr:GNAT family N-acetyltransferase [Oscillospiraceae bacterium]